MFKVECPKCSGTGHINAFNHVAGGTCFTCQGRGYRLYKNKPTVSKTFVVGAQLKETGEWLEPIFRLKAKSQSAAEKRVRVQLTGSGYYPETAKVTEVV